MKKLLSLFLVCGLCFGLVGCGGNEDSDSGSAEVSLSKYPKIEEKSEVILQELKGAPSLVETQTSIIYKNASSNTDNIIALHYDTSNEGEAIFQFYIDTAELKGVSFNMEKSKAESSDDYLALVSATASITDFEFDEDMYDQLGDVVSEFKTTTINDLTVSMKDNEGNMEFSIFRD